MSCAHPKARQAKQSKADLVFSSLFLIMDQKTVLRAFRECVSEHQIKIGEGASVEGILDRLASLASHLGLGLRLEHEILFACGQTETVSVSLL